MISIFHYGFNTIVINLNFTFDFVDHAPRFADVCFTFLWNLVSNKTISLLLLFSSVSYYMYRVCFSILHTFQMIDLCIPILYKVCLYSLWI